MAYEVPDSVSLVIGAHDTQMGFVRRALMEAARRAGLPLLEQNDYANFILQLPLNQAERDKLLDRRKQTAPPQFRLIWTKGDPSPKNNTGDIIDSEFEAERKSGRKFKFSLREEEKEELRRRQIYYQLYGGVLGSMREIPRDTDIIIVDLNLIYQEENYNATTAQNEFGKYVTDAVKVYEPLGIKFNIDSWTAGSATFKVRGGFLEAVITKGAVTGYHDVIFGRRSGNTSEERFSLAYTTFDSSFNPVASFIYKGALGGGGVGFSYELRTHALAHELGHVFGLLGSPEISDPTARNRDADWDIDKAIVKLLSGEIKKGVHWNRSDLILPDATGKIEYLTIFDKIRAGARAVARKV